MFDDEHFFASRPREENYLSFVGRHQFSDMFVLEAAFHGFTDVGLRPDDFLLYGEGYGGELAARLAVFRSGLVERAIAASPTGFTIPFYDYPWPIGIDLVFIELEQPIDEPAHRTLGTFPARTLRATAVTVLTGFRDHEVPVDVDPAVWNARNRRDMAEEWMFLMNAFAFVSMENPFLVTTAHVSSLHFQQVAQLQFEEWLQSGTAVRELVPEGYLDP